MMTQAMVRFYHWITLLSLGFVAIGAKAEAPASVTNLPSDVPAATMSGRVGIEIGAIMNGSLGANTKTDSDGNRVFLSDSNLSIGARRYFSENLALIGNFDFGAAVMDGGRDIHSAMQNDGAYEIYLEPLLLGARYQGTQFGGSELLHPYAEISFGPTFTALSRGHGIEGTTAYLTARPSLGLDVFFTRAEKAYAGVRASYLAVNHPDLSALQSAVTAGYVF